MVHSLVNDGEPRFSFICLTGERFPQQLAFRYLNKIRHKFLLKYRNSMFDKASTVRCEPPSQKKKKILLLSLGQMLIASLCACTVEMNSFSQSIRRAVKRYKTSRYTERMKVQHLPLLAFFFSEWYGFDLPLVFKEEEGKGEAAEAVPILRLDEGLYATSLKKPLMVRHLHDPSLQLGGMNSF